MPGRAGARGTGERAWWRRSRRCRLPGDQKASRWRHPAIRLPPGEPVQAAQDPRFAGCGKTPKAKHPPRRERMKRIVLALLLVAASYTTTSAVDVYEIQVSKNDEIFVINDELFKAKTYCFQMEVGDQVIFLEGSPYGACVSAEVLNLRTKKRCELWCE